MCQVTVTAARTVMVTGGNHVTYGDVDGDDHVTG